MKGFLKRHKTFLKRRLQFISKTLRVAEKLTLNNHLQDIPQKQYQTIKIKVLRCTDKKEQIIEKCNRIRLVSDFTTQKAKYKAKLFTTTFKARQHAKQTLSKTRKFNSMILIKVKMAFQVRRPQKNSFKHANETFLSEIYQNVGFIQETSANRLMEWRQEQYSSSKNNSSLGRGLLMLSSAWQKEIPSLEDHPSSQIISASFKNTVTEHDKQCT